MKNSAAVALLAASSLIVLVACDGDAGVSSEGEGAPATTTTTTTVDANRDAILSEVEEVRALLAESASAIPAEALVGVDFQGTTLTVTVNETVQAVAQAESLCADLASSVQLPDLSVEVADEGGVVIARCQLAGE